MEDEKSEEGKEEEGKGKERQEGGMKERRGIKGRERNHGGRKRRTDSFSSNGHHVNCTLTGTEHRLRAWHVNGGVGGGREERKEQQGRKGGRECSISLCPSVWISLSVHLSSPSR